MGGERVGRKPTLPPQAWELLLELVARARGQVEEGKEWLPVIVAIGSRRVMVIHSAGWRARRGGIR